MNGKRSGRGKEYDEKGELKFEGDYLNGEKHGYIKQYKNYKLIFEGECKNGKANGIGKYYKDDVYKIKLFCGFVSWNSSKKNLKK